MQDVAGGANYLTLHQNLAMKIALRPAVTRRKYPNEIPYDYSNPAIDNDTMKKQTFTHCKMYFGAINVKNIRQKMCTSRGKQVQDSNSRTRENNVVIASTAPIREKVASEHEIAVDTTVSRAGGWVGGWGVTMLDGI